MMKLGKGRQPGVQSHMVASDKNQQQIAKQGAKKPAIKGFFEKAVVKKEVHAKLGPINKLASRSQTNKLPQFCQKKFQQARDFTEEERVL